MEESHMSIESIIGIVIIVGLIFYVVSLYNGMVRLKNRFKNAYSQIDVQLKRRYDLIPNLVETAKAYVKHERETLEAVIAARNTAVAANQRAALDPGDQSAIEGVIGAEAALTGTLGKLFALSENYPDLKANQTMEKLMEELTSTENKISFARQSFNDSVMVYNTAMESFPDNIIASIFHFTAATLWRLQSDEEREPVKVSF